MRLTVFLFFFPGLILAQNVLPTRFKLILTDRLTDSILTGGKILITINDSLKFTPASSENGARFISATPGKYSFRIDYLNYNVYEMRDVWIGLAKTVELNFSLTPKRPLTKKEKKQLKNG